MNRSIHLVEVDAGKEISIQNKQSGINVDFTYSVGSKTRLIATGTLKYCAYTRLRAWLLTCTDAPLLQPPAATMSIL